jgi:hypothetical protein
MFGREHVRYVLTANEMAELTAFQERRYLCACNAGTEADFGLPCYHVASKQDDKGMQSMSDSLWTVLLCCLNLCLNYHSLG